MTAELELVLLPPPRELRVGDGSLSAGAGMRVVIPAPADERVWTAARRLTATAREVGCGNWTIHAGTRGQPPFRASRLPILTCELETVAHRPAEGYQVRIDASGVRLLGYDIAGLCYGLVTLTQLVRQCAGDLPMLEIEDWPEIQRRGLMLDQSRDRVATLETIKVVAEDMALMKLNELQLYCEHTFAYVDREVVWAGDGAFSAEEILDLDRFCRDRNIDLVPTMNSLGHLHKWLEHPEYADLAENYPYRSLPEMRIALTAERTPLWGEVPFSLCATDARSADFVDELMDELLPNFTSQFVNPNLDEPFDLGLGRSRTEVEARGRAWVYLDYLKAQNERVRARGLTMLFGSDVTWSDPEIIGDLPKDAIIMDWGYCAEFPYREHAQGFAEAGQPFYILTGTNSWESIVGATDDMVEHHRLAGLALQEFGGLGLLVTDWGWYDYGTIQQHIITYPGIAAAAANGWAPGATTAADLQAALSRLVFAESDDDVLGRLLFELGALSTVIGLSVSDIGGVKATVRSPIFAVLRGTLADARKALDSTGTGAQQLRTVLAELDRLEGQAGQSSSARADAASLAAELDVTIAMMRHACQRGLLALTDAGDEATSLADGLRRDLPGLLAAFAERWLGRYRPANLWRTIERFERSSREY